MPEIVFPRYICITHYFKGIILRIYKIIIKIFHYRESDL